MALAALLALAMQSFVVQTHVHVAQRALTPDAVPAAGTVRPADHRTHPSAPLDCPACRQLARGGTAVLPAPLAPSIPAAVVPWFVLLPLVPGTARARSHAWRSRGPPRPIRARS